MGEGVVMAKSRLHPRGSGYNDTTVEADSGPAWCDDQGAKKHKAYGNAGTASISSQAVEGTTTVTARRYVEYSSLLTIVTVMTRSNAWLLVLRPTQNRTAASSRGTGTAAAAYAT